MRRFCVGACAFVFLFNLLPVVYATQYDEHGALDEQDSTVYTLADFTPSGKIEKVSTENPTFQQLLDAETAEDLDLLLYPHMPEFPFKYVDFACFNCVNTEIEVSSETWAFLSGYFWDADGPGYTNAEVIAAQMYVGLAMMYGDDMFAAAEVMGNTPGSHNYPVTGALLDLDVCKYYIKSQRDFLQESSNFLGPLNIKGVPFSIGVSSEFDINVSDRDSFAYKVYWEGVTERMTKWGAIFTSYNTSLDLNPFLYQHDLGLPYPGKLKADTEEPSAEVENPDTSADISVPGDSSTSLTDPTFGETNITGEHYIPETPNQYMEYMLGEKDRAQNATVDEDELAKQPLRFYGASDYLLILSVVLVIVVAIVFGISDWMRKRKDPTRNYPRWR